MVWAQKREFKFSRQSSLLTSFVIADTRKFKLSFLSHLRSVEQGLDIVKPAPTNSINQNSTFHFLHSASSKAMKVSRHIFLISANQRLKKGYKFYLFPLTWHGLAESGEDKIGNIFAMREDFVAITMIELRANGAGLICFSPPAGRQALQALSPHCEEDHKPIFISG